MALVVYDRVQETTNTTGTGAVTLAGAVTGFQSFAVVGNGNTTFYCILNGTQWEVGIGTYSTTGPTLTRTTVLSNSLGTTAAITLSGSSNVFVTYPSEKSVNLDASGNVSPLGTISSGTWNGTTIGVAYGGTGVTASSGANSVVLRDANSNATFNNFISGAVAVTAAAGTTVLTAASARTQILVGSTTQTFQLPNATTLALGQSFIFVNNSSGLLTVKDNASTTVETVPSGGVTQLAATSIATSAGSWGAYSFIPAAVDWGTNALALGSTVISGGTWQGGTIGGAYGGTGLTTFSAANNAIYSTGATTLTAGTLPFAAGGTGATSYTANYIPYVNSTNTALTSNIGLQFNGTYLIVGGTTPLSGATNPIAAFSSTANNYVQTYTYNANSGISGSADFVAYTNNSTDTHGWADMGFTSSTYADTTYTVTGPNEAYLLGSAPSGAGATGNLVYATDNTGSANAHQWYVGGFTQAKSAWKMQLTSTGLQLANALSASYGGTGILGTLTGISYMNGTSAHTVATAAQIVSGIGSTFVANATFATTAGTASTTNAITFNNGGTGGTTGSTFNGASALTVSYNTIGAPSTTGTNASGTWGISISGNAATATSATSATSATTATTATTANALNTANAYQGTTFTATTQFSGPGTGLTGTASGLTVGTATNATNLSGGTVAATTISATGGYTATSAAPFYLNATTVSSNFTVPTNYNATSAGKITINTGIVVTVSTGSRWVIV